MSAQDRALRSGRALALLVSVEARAQVQLVDYLAGAFVDIASTGQHLSLADDGEVDVASALGNSLFPAGTYRVGANGGLRVGSSGEHRTPLTL